MRRNLWCSVVAALVVAVGSFSPAVEAANRSITSGSTLTGTITDADNWYFTGQAGDTILIKAVNDNFAQTVKTMAVAVYEPGEGEVASQPCGNGMFEFHVQERIPPDAPGTVRNFYFLATNGPCDPSYAGFYNVSLLNITRGPLTSINDPDGGGYVANAYPEFDSSIPSGGLSDMDAYLLQAKGGDALKVTVSVDAQSPYDGPSPMVLLYDPYGNYVYGSCGEQFDYDLLPGAPSGLYTVIFQDCDYAHGNAPWNGTYDLTAFFTNFRGQINSGETKSYNIASGTSHEWELKAEDFLAGDRVIVQAFTEATSSPMRIQLYDQDGNKLAERTNCTSSSNFDVVLPPHAGSLFLKASNVCSPNQYNSYNISVLNLTRGDLTTAVEDEGGPFLPAAPDPPPPLYYEPEFGAVGSSDMDAYWFTGMENDRVTIYAGSSVKISLYPPGGGEAITTCGSSLTEYPLTAPGKYTVALEACDPASTSPLFYALNMDHILNMTDMGPIASGETVQGDIEYGVWHKWGFTGNPGDEVIVNTTLADSTYGMEIETKGPSGETYPQGTFPCPGFPYTNPGSRSFRTTIIGPEVGYTIAVRSCEPGYSDTHRYSLTLLNTSGTLISTFDPGNPGRLVVNDPDGGAVLPGETVDTQPPLGPERPFPSFNAMHSGDLDAYQFYGEPGDLVIIKASGTLETQPRIGLYRPADYPGSWPDYDTKVSLGSCGGQETLQEVVLDYPGIYTIVLEDCTNNGSLENGNYFFTLEKLPGTYAVWDPAAGGRPDLDPDGGLVGSYYLNEPIVGAGSVDKASDMDVYYFYTTGSESVNIGLQPTPFNAQVSVYPLLSASAPWQYGAPIFAMCNNGANISQDLVLNGAEPGFYAVLVTACPNYFGLGVYTLTVTPTNIETPIRFPHPENGQEVANAFEPDFLSWQPASASNGYFVEFGPADGQLVRLNSGALSQTASYPLPYEEMTPGKTYQWRVVSSHPSLGEVAGPIWQFTFSDCTPAFVGFTADLDFGSVLANTTATQRVTITNDGTCFQQPTPSMATPDPPFRIVATDCPAGPAGGDALAPGISCTIDVEFSPTDAQIASGGITLSGFIPGTFPAGNYPPPYVPVIDLTGQGFTRDLRVSALTAGQLPGSGAISVTETTENTGSAAVDDPTTTRFYLSLDTTFDLGVDTDVTGRSVPALASGGSSTVTSLTLSVPGSLTPGDYYLIACADHGVASSGVVAESDESNNCRATATPIALPDLRLTSVTVASPVLGSFEVADTTLSDGAAAGASVTSYYLSTDTTITTEDTLWYSRDVPGLAASASSSPGSPATLLVPNAIPEGTYNVGACVDADDVVAESNEGNNCMLSPGMQGFQVRRDLLVWDIITKNPAQPAADGTFDFADEILNSGTSTVSIAGAIVTYHLSLDLKLTRMDPEIGSRTLPVLTPNSSSIVTNTLAVPSNTPPGSYFVFACVDYDGVIPETDETNNCQHSLGTIKVAPDLEVLSATVVAGTAAFIVTDSTRNKGLAAAAASTVRFWLSADPVISSVSDKLLTGTRSVPVLEIGATSKGTTTVTIPAAVLRDNDYWLGICVDDQLKVSEIDESNNCIVYPAQITLDAADLMIVSMSNPPGTGYVGQSFMLNDTTRNDATSQDAAAGASTTAFRLSLNQIFETADPQIGTRKVPALGAGGESAAATKVTIPANLSPPTGVSFPVTYYLLVCADSAKAVPEGSNEPNNCRASGTTITVNVPDLTVTALGDPPASAAVGTSFAVTDRTRNASSTTKAVASSTRYRLSTDDFFQTTDPLLTGTRAVPALAASTSSAGGAIVTIPATLATGLYHLVACSDDAKAIKESDDLNNCLVNTGSTVDVTAAPVDPKPELVITSLTVSPTPPAIPPYTGAHGTSFSVPWVAMNQGTAATTEIGQVEFRLIAESKVVAGSDPLVAGKKVTTADPLLAGISNFSSGLGVNQTTSANSTATISFTLYSVPAGTYYVAACVDAKKVIAESDETNNCRVDSDPDHRITVQKGDLGITTLSAPPADAVPGVDTFQITDTTRNAGLWNAWASTTRYRLIAASKLTPADLASSLLAGKKVTTADPLLYGVGPDISKPATRAIFELGPGSTFMGTVEVSIPSTITQGTYYLAACADELSAVPESDEKNNCYVRLPDTIDILSPDLVVTALVDPPASKNAGESFTLTTITGPPVRNATTTENVGLTAASASITRYRLTLDTNVTSADPLLTGTRAVPALIVGAEDTVSSITLTIPITAPAGTYYLAACADDMKTVKESIETNNCLVSDGQITVNKPDLQNTEVPATPASPLYVGSSFSVTDRIQNFGAAPTPVGKTFTTRYRFSLDTTITSSDPLLTGSRTVPALDAAGGAKDFDMGTTTTVTIPDTVPAGVYYLAACADDAGVVSESVETNNCNVSADPVQLFKPDLEVIAVSEPPKTRKAGETFSVSDTTKNSGQHTAATSVTRYRLSADAVITTADPVLINDTPSRDVPSLDAGAEDAGPTITVTIPTNTVFQGYYYLAACADYPNGIKESDETNNCFISQDQVYVGNPDLTVDVINPWSSGNPYNMAYAGETIDVSCTVENIGSINAAASGTRFRLSADKTITTSDTLLTGTVPVGALDPSVNPTEAIAGVVTIPSSVAEGSYYLGACADDAKGVAESNEANNCLAYTTTTIYVAKSNLWVNFASLPPDTGWPGMKFDVGDTTYNYGYAPVRIQTTNSYHLYSPTTHQKLYTLAGARTVGVLDGNDGVMDSDTGTREVTIPAAVPAGTYSLGVCVDSGSKVAENDENNCYELQGLEYEMTVAVGADLRVRDITHPATVSRNVNFTLTETTYNDGTLPADFTTTTRYILSADTTINLSRDIRFSPTRTVPTLTGGAASASANITLRISSSTVTPGSYFLAVCADDLRTVPETDETNNCTLSPVTVQ